MINSSLVNLVYCVDFIIFLYCVLTMHLVGAKEIETRIKILKEIKTKPILFVKLKRNRNKNTADKMK